MRVINIYIFSQNGGIMVRENTKDLKENSTQFIILFNYCFFMKSRNFNYIGDDLMKEWESSYLKNNPQTKKGGLRNLEEIREKEVFPKSNGMINKLEKDCKSHIPKFQRFWDKVKEKEDLFLLNEQTPNIITNKLLGNEFEKMFHEYLPDDVEIYETKKKEYF